MDRRSIIMGLGAAAGAAVIGLPRSAHAESFTEGTGSYFVRCTRLASGLAYPWGMDFLPTGQILISERSGRLRYFTNGRLSAPLTGVPSVYVSGQGGLMDVVLHPRFAENKLVYFTYVEGSGSYNRMVLARARLNSTSISSVQKIFRCDPGAGTNQHFGGRIAFDSSGYLFVSTGDRQNRERAQWVSNHDGKVLRLHDDGRVPTSNPYYGTSYKQEIWSIGHRNPQGLAIQPGTGRLIDIEHGPEGGDEVNIVERRLNYGWPKISWGCDYGANPCTPIGGGQAPGLVQPIKYWTPSIAPAGAGFYTGNRFPEWRGNLFVGVLKAQCVSRLKFDSAGTRIVQETQFLKNKVGRVRHIKQGPGGKLYFITDSSNGSLWEMDYAGTRGSQLGA